MASARCSQSHFKHILIYTHVTRKSYAHFSYTRSFKKPPAKTTPREMITWDFVSMRSRSHRRRLIVIIIVLAEHIATTSSVGSVLRSQHKIHRYHAQMHTHTHIQQDQHDARLLSTNTKSRRERRVSYSYIYICIIYA